MRGSFARYVPGDFRVLYRTLDCRMGVEVEERVFAELLLTERFSVWAWKDGVRLSANAVSCSGLMYDFDDGRLSLDEARERLIEAGVHAYLMPSKSHGKEKHGVVCDRFHIFIPFYRPVDVEIGSDLLVSQAWATIDRSGLDRARFFDPPQSVELIRGSAGYFNPYRGLSMGNTYPAELEVKLGTGEYKQVQEITAVGKVACHCPFHEDKTPSAFVKVLEDGRQMLYCSACASSEDAATSGVWWLETNGEVERQSLLDRMFLYDNTLMEVMRKRDGSCYAAQFTPRGPYLDTGEVKRAKATLAGMGRKWAPGCFIEEHLKGGMGLSPGYAFTDDGIQFIEPMAEARVEDNRLVESWLRERFGSHVGFIKKWLSVYAFENFKNLPVIVLSGNRGGGKSTFAEVVSSLYPRLSRSWDGKLGAFNSELEGSLVVVDDNSNDKKDLYVMLKATTGRTTLPINRKYGPQLEVRNNVNFIITSNEVTPISVHSIEEADCPENNQWFFYEMPALGQELRGDMRDRLIRAFPNYARTVLKSLHDEWLSSEEAARCRYGVASPITEDQAEVFASSRFQPEIDADIVFEFLAYSPEARDMAFGEIKRQYGKMDGGTILICDVGVNEVVRSGLAGRITSSAKSIISHMRQRGRLTKRAVRRSNGVSWYALVVPQQS